MTEFQEKLKRLMHLYVRFAYRITKKFPREELYGITSQLRRAAVSIILNYIEGYARRRPAVLLQFFETSYGSLKESRYLLILACEEGYITKEELHEGIRLAEEIGAMVWSEIESVESKVK